MLLRSLALAAALTAGCDSPPASTATPAADATVQDTKSTDAGGDDLDPAGDATQAEVTTPPEDLAMTAADFDCILEWEHTGSYYLTNLLGHTDEALAVAASPDGGTFPVGTVVQLVPFEAMVKRAPGFSPPTRDWEFFSLEVTAQGTSILARGTQDVVNQFDGNCFSCHAKAAPQWDFICGTDHGCDPLPLTRELIETLQQADERCAR